MTWWTILLQSCIGVLTISGSFLAARLGARETELRSRREEWWRRYTWAVDAINSEDSLKVAAGCAALESMYFAELAGEYEKSVVLDTLWAVMGGTRPTGLDITLATHHWSPFDPQSRIASFLVRNDHLATRNRQIQNIARREENRINMFAARELLQAHDAFDFVHIVPFNGVDDVWSIYHQPSGSNCGDITALIREKLPRQRIRLAEVENVPLTSSGKPDAKALIASYPVGPEIPLQTRGGGRQSEADI
ncbi:hypothetical protein [Nocardia cyriacigeorgica]|uniref:hypothetical protein n=1 Tax=Nocardia cyriacigeorgica TaxID=135487 RepID=UPI0011AFF87B|nr:hypothetical protein [Nocardia cyriacigeorgica]MBF6325906.1 hypothetical protein [Nocardia cyriacigeorgica]